MTRHSVALGVTTALAGLLLTGCISRQEMLARHRTACVTYGFTPGTESYANCLLQLEVGDYGYGHHGRRRAWSHGRPEPVAPPPAPEQQ